MGYEWTWIDGVPKHIRNHLDTKWAREIQWSQCQIEVEETELRLVWPSGQDIRMKCRQHWPAWPKGRVTANVKSDINR